MGIFDPFLPQLRDNDVGPEEIRTLGKNGALLSPHMTGEPIWKSWTTDNAVKHGYIASEWVRACVDSIATPAAQVPWRVSSFDSRTDEKRFQRAIKEIPAWERAQYIKSHEDAGNLKPEPEHPLEILIEEPNRVFTRHDMIERLTQHLLLGGNGLLHLNRGSTRRAEPLEIWPVDPDGIEVKPSKTKIIDHYKYEKGEIKLPRIPPEDIVHVMLPDPSNALWGVSVLQTLAKVVDTDVEAVNYNKILLQNMATPSGILNFKRTLRREEWEEARAMLAEEYAGSKNAGRPMILGNEANYMRLSMSPEELNFLASRKLNRDSICTAFRVNPAVLGVGEGTNYSALREARIWHWIDTVLPYLDRLTAALNLKVTKNFGDNLVLWYDTQNVEALQVLFNEKINTAKVIWTMGVPFQEINARLRLGFPNDIPGTDVGYLPASGLAIVEEGGLTMPANPNQPNEGDQESAPDGGSAVTDQGGDSTEEGPKGKDDNSKGEKFSILEQAERRWGWREAR